MTPWTLYAKIFGAVVLSGVLLTAGLKIRNTIVRAAMADQLVEDLRTQEQQSIALAKRFRLEAERRWQAEERERELNEHRAIQQRQARNEYERITREIMDALDSEACSAVAVPVNAVDRLREFAAYANGVRGNPGGQVRSDSLRID